MSVKFSLFSSLSTHIEGFLTAARRVVFEWD